MRYPHPSRWLNERPALADVLLALFVLTFGVVNLFVGVETGAGIRSLDAFAVVLIAAMSAPIAWRRRSSVTAMVVACIAVMIYDALSYPGTVASSGLLIALYSMAAHGQPRHRVNQAGAIAFVATGAWFGAGIALGVRGATFWNLIGNYIIFITAFVLGDNVRRRRERLHDLEQRAADLEHTRALETEHAVAAERTRISRELHDVVAHSISVMVVQAGAARRVIDQDPGRAAEAMAQVERTGRDALTEMRRLLGVLRSDDEDALRAPQPSLARLADLVSSDPELRVQLTIEGPPQELPATVDTSAYRIVQEALTNIRKHAGRTGAEVVVQYAPGELCLTVADRGRGASTFLAERADGHGLLGMRERAALVGGELQAGPRPGGGWQVRARLPFEAN